MLKRLQAAKSNFNVKQWNSERKQTEKRLNQITNLITQPDDKQHFQKGKLGRVYLASPQKLRPHDKQYLSNKELYDLYNQNSAQYRGNTTSQQIFESNMPQSMTRTFMDLSEKKIMSAYEPQRDGIESPTFFPDIKQPMNEGFVTQNNFLTRQEFLMSE